MIQDTAAAALGLLVDYAMGMYTSPAGRQTMAPPADSRLPPTWELRGYICGVDAERGAGISEKHHAGSADHDIKVPDGKR